MYAENKTCRFFQFELYSLELNEVIKRAERGIVYEGSAPTWDQLVGATAEFLESIDDDYTHDIEDEEKGTVERYWITSRNVNGEAVIVRIIRPATPPTTPSR